MRPRGVSCPCELPRLLSTHAPQAPHRTAHTLYDNRIREHTAGWPYGYTGASVIASAGRPSRGSQCNQACQHWAAASYELAVSMQQSLGGRLA